MLRFLKRSKRTVDAEAVSSHEVIRNLDAPDASSGPLEDHEKDVLAGVRRRLSSSDFDLPTSGDDPAKTMESHLLGDENLVGVGREVWRQITSTAATARALAGFMTDIDPERGEAIGRFQEIGKVSMLAMLRRESAGMPTCGTALVARVFGEGHERAGFALATAWKLPEEIAVVAGRHHDWENHDEYLQSAALASLSNRIDLHLSLGQQEHFENLTDAKELDVLDIPPDLFWDSLMAASCAFADAVQGW
ncbi:MAG: hypothetical protein CMJ83_05690 [Planctomycetes bacterium]|nr:hypothetical protein [Planctomycetota bacterium]